MFRDELAGGGHDRVGPDSKTPASRREISRRSNTIRLESVDLVGEEVERLLAPVREARLVVERFEDAGCVGEGGAAR